MKSGPSREASPLQDFIASPDVTLLLTKALLHVNLSYAQDSKLFRHEAAQ